MKSIPAGEFKARCLRVMEDVKRYRTAVVITKKGRPVAKLVPPDGPAPDVFGCMAGTARIVGNVEAPVGPAHTWGAFAPPPSRRRAPRRRSRRSTRR
jgi:prevent-host-death family protein